MSLVELYNKPGFGRRLRRVLAAATVGMAKLKHNFYSSRPVDAKQLSFVGPNIANIGGTNGIAITTVQTSAAFNGGGTRVFSKGGAWPGWAALSSTTGAITGTAATGSSPGLSVICTAAGFGSAQSNTFSITI